MKYLPVVTALEKYINASANFSKRDDPSFFEEFFLPFLLTMLISLIVYCVPVLIYRFGIRHGEPIKNKWKAQGISWLFWIGSFTAMCLYYLIAGYYDIEGFSVRPGLPDFLCLIINWVILFYTRKNSKSRPQTPSNNPTASHTSIRKCTKCGVTLPQSAKFCSKCGTKVPPPVPDGMIICPGCQKTVTIGNYCPECGHKFDSDQTNSSPKQYVRTYPPPRTTQLEQKMMSQYSAEEMKRILEKERKKEPFFTYSEKVALVFWGVLVGVLLLIFLVAAIR